ncbi:ABC transporter permease [Billgrantia pellis]|nr:ABC transporter permease [Halomonas pellis]
MSDPLRRGLHDLTRTLQRLPVILYFSWTDTKARYIRSVLGPFWLVLGTLIGVIGLGVLWTALLDMNAREYFPSLAIGLVLWQWVSGCVSQAPSTLVQQGPVIRNIDLPATFFCFGPVIGQTVTFVHNLIIVLLVLIVFPPNTGWANLVLSLLGLMLTFVNLLWVSTALAFAGARFRDLDPAVTAVMPLLFFLSPVLFRVHQLPINAAFVWLNPFSYPITAIREPLLGTPPDPLIYLVLAVSALLGWLSMVWLVGSHGKRLPFWI